LAKIAVELEQALARRAVTGAPGHTTARRLAEGDGWTVADVVCTSGPQDRPFEEQHTNVSIAMVLAGSFQYRRAPGCELMTPGSLLLGSTGQCFECRHEHGYGDRCLAFSYTPDYFERLAFDAQTRSEHSDFRVLRLPPLRALSPLVARASAALAEPDAVPWEELSLEVAARTVQLASGVSHPVSDAPPSTVARVTRAVRMIERNPHAKLTLASLARQAGLSPYHFLRTFQQLTGLTPHQYILRARLREAAMRLVAEPEKVLDIALDCGFGDVSNFNRAFRSEFGVSPRAFRRKANGIHSQPQISPMY
jgi:AraC family transcriptional regulator